MSTLYELDNEALALLELMEDPDADPEVVKDTLDAVLGERNLKYNSYGFVRQQMKADIAAVKSEKDRLDSRQKVMENNLKRLDDHVLFSMNALGETKVKTELFTFSIQKNPPKVIIDDPDLIPEYFKIPQEPKIDTAAIKDLLKSGDENHELDGAAHLEQGESLRIR